METHVFGNKDKFTYPSIPPIYNSGILIDFCVDFFRIKL